MSDEQHKPTADELRAANPRVPLLKAARVSRGLSQRDAAKGVGVSRETLTRAERGEPIQPKTAKRLADFYGLRVLDFWVEDEAA